MAAFDRCALVDQAFARCLPHWGGEFAIAVRYFEAGSRMRSPERDRRWLEFQIWKEWFGSGVYGPRGVTVADLLQQAVQRVRMPGERDGAHGLEEVCSLLDFGRDEFAHFTVLFELWRRSFADAPAAVARWGALPAGKALMELRYRLREDPLGALAVRLSEGGGLGLFFGIQHALHGEGGPFERGLQQVVVRILDDERGHLVGNFVHASRQVESAAEIEAVVGHLDEICTVKLREREQQFEIHLEGSMPPEAALYQERYLAPMRAEILAQARA